MLASALQTQSIAPAGGLAPRPASPLQYRPDVDGLRAVAVLLVVASHVQLGWTGGYIGVDVFFVISGYLISAILLREFAAHDFSLVRFYERRVRRIIPALLVVLVVTTLLAVNFLMPHELVDYAQSLLAALFSVSNILFRHQSNYFDAPSALKPLLHTWTLGVEEQFYIAFPLCLMVLHRFCWRRLRPALWLAFVLSLAAAVAAMHFSRVAAFYLSPLRAWELLAGTLLSQGYLPRPKSTVARNVTAALGIAFIAVCGWFYTAASPFPGLLAIPPVLGAVLFIAAGEHGPTFVGRALSWRPIVFVGLISYSLYLWHWPLIVFSRMDGLLLRTRGPLAGSAGGTPAARWGVVAVSFVLATLTWRFVEVPVRSGKHRPHRRTLFILAGAGVAACAAIGGVLLLKHGLPGRLPVSVRAMADFPMDNATAAAPELYAENTCFVGPHVHYDHYRADLCMTPSQTKPNLLLLGDSHAAHLYPGLKDALPGWNILLAAVPRCFPYPKPTDDAPEDCREMLQAEYQKFLPQFPPSVVLLSARWDEEHLGGLPDAIAWLRAHGMTSVVAGPNPEFTTSLPRVLTLAELHGDSGEPSKYLNPNVRALDLKMAALARDEWHVPYISVYDQVCSAAGGGQPNCPFLVGDIPLLFDDDHFTGAGSRLLAQRLRDSGAIPQPPKP